MLKNVSLLVAMGGLIFGSFSSSSHYNLNNYSLGPGGTNSSQSSTYRTQSTLGEQANGTTSSVTKTGPNGSTQTEQLSVPLAPTLSNGSNLYYNKLQITLDDTAGSSNYPTDTTFAIAVSTTPGFGTTFYVQADGSLNSSPVYQAYAAWGGSSGSFIIGLSSNQAYYAKVAAKQGLFTNTALGVAGTATTATPSTTFSVSPSTISIGSLLPATIKTSANLTFGFSTNAATGGAVYVYGAKAGLFSATQNSLIGAFTGNLATPSQGFGIQASNATQTSGGPFTLASPFNNTGNVVGADSTVPQKMLTSSFPITGGSANANMQAKASTTTPAGLDYQETLTFVASGNF